MLYVAGLGLKDIPEKYSVTIASKESIKRCFHRYLKQRTHGFFNSINTRKIQSIEDYASTIEIRNIHIIKT